MTLGTFSKESQNKEAIQPLSTRAQTLMGKRCWGGVCWGVGCEVVGALGCWRRRKEIEETSVNQHANHQLHLSRVTTSFLCFIFLFLLSRKLRPKYINHFTLKIKIKVIQLGDKTSYRKPQEVTILNNKLEHILHKHYPLQL